MPGTVIKVLVARGRRGRRAPAAARPRGDEDGDAADCAVRRRRAQGARRRRRPRWQAARCSSSSRLLEELLELHRRAHVALDLQLARHVGGRRVLLAAEDLLEVLFARRDRRSRPCRRPLATLTAPSVDRDEPFAGAVDVEQVACCSCPQFRRIGARGQSLEELACRLRHRADITTGPRASGSSLRRARDGGRRSVSARPASGAAAQT